MHSNEYKILKILNNNVALACQNGNEKILFSKGIGFKAKPNDILNPDIHLEKIFTIQNENNVNKFNQLLDTVDDKVVGLCEEVINMIDNEFDDKLNEKIHIALTDHIAFSLMRLKENNEISNPFLVETETLYKDEYRVAEKAAAIIEKRTEIKIPEGEIGFIALHIHSARGNKKLSNTMKTTFIINSIIEMIEDEFNIIVDRDSIDYARFAVHLKFAVNRITTNKPIKNKLLDVIKKEYSSSYALAEKVSEFIEKELNSKVIEDEIGYIAVYIEKIRNAF